jgi:hypothetical protein
MIQQDKSSVLPAATKDSSDRNGCASNGLKAALQERHNKAKAVFQNTGAHLEE